MAAAIKMARMKTKTFILFCAALLPAGVTFAAAPITKFDPVAFEQRFHKADKDKNGKLSRTEAYAEFPRMPEFFDEIDGNKDDAITLVEVRRALDKRINAAIEATKQPKKFGYVESGADTPAPAPSAAEQPKQFSSAAEARRYTRNQYYEALAGSKARARERGEPVIDAPTNPVIKKSF
jgi:hypothetical protein